MSRTVKDLPDYKERKRLAKLIGLDDVPELDSSAFDELEGLWDDLFSEGEEIDSVELVKQIRYRDYKKFDFSAERVKVEENKE